MDMQGWHGRRMFGTGRAATALMTRGLRSHIGLAVVVLVALTGANVALEAAYVASGHPASVFAGQTAFRATTIQGWYAAMLERGTLDVYIWTQVLDYAFIAAVASTGLVWSTLLARLSGGRRALLRSALAAGALMVLGAGLDAVENLVSFAMLADPLDFAGWLAPIYSTIAIAKYVAMTIGGGGLLLAAAALGVVRAVGRLGTLVRRSHA